MLESLLIVDSAGSLEAIFDAGEKLLAAPFRRGDANHRDIEIAAFCHRIERGEDHFVGEIARHAEKHEGIRGGWFHEAAPLAAAIFMIFQVVM
jgi:hypothetical protein